jgi:hypothetical protein
MTPDFQLTLGKKISENATLFVCNYRFPSTPTNNSDSLPFSLTTHNITTMRQKPNSLENNFQRRSL